MFRWFAVAAVLTSWSPRDVWAEPSPEEPAPVTRVSTARRAGAIVAAIVPGFVIHGTGSYLVDERPTARQLVRAGSLGLLAAVVGGALAGVTRANPYASTAGAPLLVTGMGVSLTTWAADIWVAAGGRLAPGARAVAPWSLELATTVQDDALRTRWYAGGAGRIALGRAELRAAALVDTGGAAREGELEAGVRLLGAAPSGAFVDDASRLAVRIAARGRDDDDDELRSLIGEVELAGRLDLVRLDPRLAGWFGELSTGLGVERVAYHAGTAELGALLLGGFATGVYLGRRGELALFYDHRRDHLAGGLVAGRAAGFMGSFGLRAEVRVHGPWALGAAAELGSAWVGTLALRYLGGPR